MLLDQTAYYQQFSLRNFRLFIYIDRFQISFFALKPNNNKNHLTAMMSYIRYLTSQITLKRKMKWQAMT